MNKKLKIALAQLNPLVGDVSGNVDKLLKIRSELKNDVDLLVAPELYISGYPIDDLVLREDFLNLVEVEIKRLVENTKDGKSAIIFGAPRRDNTLIKNSVYVVENGKIGAIKNKAIILSKDSKISDFRGIFDDKTIIEETGREYYSVYVEGDYGHFRTELRHNLYPVRSTIWV